MYCLQTNLECPGYKDMTDEGKRSEKLVKWIPLLGTENGQSQENLSMQEEQKKIGSSIFTNPKRKWCHETFHKQR